MPFPIPPAPFGGPATVLTAKASTIPIAGRSSASSLEWAVAVQPLYGSAVLQTNRTFGPPAHANSIVYTSNAAYVGIDSVTIQVNDGFNAPVNLVIGITVQGTVVYYDVNFTVLLGDSATLVAAQTTYPNGIFDAPNSVAVQYGITVPLPITNTQDTILIFGGADGNAGLTADLASVVIPAGFVVDSYYNLIAFPTSPGGVLRWHGWFQRRGGPLPGQKEPLQAIRWMVGFERANGGEQLSGAVPQRFTRDASRTLDGMGLAFRSPANEIVSIAMPTTGPGFPTRYSWERVYVRVRRYPTADEMFWGCLGGGEGGTAGILAVTPAGTIAFYNKGNQVFPGTLATTGGHLPLNQWVKLDIVYGFASLSTRKGYIGVWVNGVKVFVVNSNGGPYGGGGLIHTLQTQLSSRLGNENTPSTGLEIDCDDWSNRTTPSLYTGDDWVLGTHIYPLKITGFGSGHSAAWVGDFRTLDGTPVNGQLDVVTTSTANALMEAETDYKDRREGCSGIMMSLFHANASGTSEMLGVEFKNGSTSSGAVTTSTASWSVPAIATEATQRIYSSGSSARLKAENHGTVKLFYSRDAVASLRDVNIIMAEAEYIGVWGPEDPANLINPEVWPPRQGPHNSPFYDSIFGQGASAFSIGPVNVHSGTYVGNGTGQDISTKVPMHWIWIRPLTGGTGGARWWSSCLSGHDPLTETPNKGNLIRCYEIVDANGVPTDYRFRVSGLNNNSNANGVVYQWCGFSDRAMRYCLNGAYLTNLGNASFTHNTFKATFLPLAGFLLPEIGVNVSTKGMYFKGTGHAADAASLMDAAESASVCAFAGGTLTPKTILNLASSQTAYSLWRILDAGGTSAGIAITNYTGDGTGARVIPLTLNGKHPWFAIVQPHNGVAYQRDPSHTGTNSNAINSSGSVPTATAITAGATNQITVGATLNAIGVVYSVFVIPGTPGIVGPGWEPNPINPITVVPPNVPPGDELPPSSMNGWWKSKILFTGTADIETVRPHDARDWQKITGFATANSGYMGGHPGPGCVVDNFFYYAGNDYNINSTQPTIRIFDGQADRLVINVPDVAGVKTIAIMVMISVAGKIYFTTYDSGTSAADYAGRVFSLDPNTLILTQLGSQFTNGNLPYALCWHMGRLWVGGNKGSGDVSSVFFFRPGIDSIWTTDRTLTGDGVGGVTSMASYRGSLYVGCDATAVMGTNKILARDSLGAWTTAYTAVSAGTFRASNGFPAMFVFNDKLYASYWNNDTVPDCYIVQFDGAGWATVYTGGGNTVRPFITFFEVQKTLFALGGGQGLAACLISTPDGNVWTNLTAFLTGPTTSTSLPIVGALGA